MSIDVIVTLSCVAFFAGFFDSIAGGGGLISLPALLIAGVNPVQAIATNKFQAAFANVSATVIFARKGILNWKKHFHLVLFAFIGGASGALFVDMIDKKLLETIVPFFLVTVAFYFLFSPKLSDDIRKEKMSVFMFSFTVTPIFGFYDGVFGPGAGSFFMVGFVVVCGLGIMHAIGLTKLANAASNIGALSVFLFKGAVVWPCALPMAIASFLGAQLGARTAVLVGPKLVKPMLVVVCLALAIKLLSFGDNPLRMMVTQFFA